MPLRRVLRWILRYRTPPTTAVLLAALALLDIAARTVSESVLLPIIILLLDETIDPRWIGWTLEWIFYFALIYRFTPSFFPTRARELTHRFGFKSITAISIVVVAILFEQAVLALIAGQVAFVLEQLVPVLDASQLQVLYAIEAPAESKYFEGVLIRLFLPEDFYIRSNRLQSILLPIPNPVLLFFLIQMMHFLLAFLVYAEENPLRNSESVLVVMTNAFFFTDVTTNDADRYIERNGQDYRFWAAFTFLAVVVLFSWFWICVLVGGLAALLNTLYPIPELLVIAFVVTQRASRTGIRLPFSGLIEFVTIDFEARVVSAAKIATYGWKGTMSLVIVLFGLVPSAITLAGTFALVTPYLRLLLQGLGDGTPSIALPTNRVRFGILIATFGIFGLYGFWFWLRELTRLPRFLESWTGRRRPRESQTFKQPNDIGALSKPRGFMIPPTLLLLTGIAVSGLENLSLLPVLPWSRDVIEGGLIVLWGVLAMLTIGSIWWSIHSTDSQSIHGENLLLPSTLLVEWFGIGILLYAFLLSEAFTGSVTQVVIRFLMTTWPGLAILAVVIGYFYLPDATAVLNTPAGRPWFGYAYSVVFYSFLTLVVYGLSGSLLLSIVLLVGSILAVFGMYSTIGTIVRRFIRVLQTMASDERLNRTSGPLFGFVPDIEASDPSIDRVQLPESSIHDVTQRSWATLRQNGGLLLLFTIIPALGVIEARATPGLGNILTGLELVLGSIIILITYKSIVGFRETTEPALEGNQRLWKRLGHGLTVVVIIAVLFLLGGLVPFLRLYLLVKFALAVPAVFIDGETVLDALRKSWTLTTGRAFVIFGLVLIITALVDLASLVGAFVPHAEHVFFVIGGPLIVIAFGFIYLEMDRTCSVTNAGP